MDTDGIILSVIIACFNDGHYLPEAVESARRNRRGLHEIIVVNDGSDDPRTLGVLNGLRDSGVRVLDQENAGLGAARNRGIAAARGRYILPLDSDNRIRPEYIDRGIEILDREPAVEVVYGDAEFFGGKTGRWHVGVFDPDRLALCNYIDACAVYRKTAWTRCKGYDEAMPAQGHEDWDLWLRIFYSGGEFRYVNEILFDYQIRSNSMTSHMLKPEQLDAIRRYINEKRIEITIGNYGVLRCSWDPVVKRFGHRPFRTVVSLLLRAYFPGLRTRLHHLRGTSLP